MRKVTVNIPAAEIPPTVARLLPDGHPVPGMRYRVTIEEDEDDAVKLAALRADIAEGLADMEAGNVAPLDVDELLSRLHATRDRAS